MLYSPVFLAEKLRVGHSSSFLLFSKLQTHILPFGNSGGWIVCRVRGFAWTIAPTPRASTPSSSAFCSSSRSCCSWARTSGAPTNSSPSGSATPSPDLSSTDSLGSHNPGDAAEFPATSPLQLRSRSSRVLRRNFKKSTLVYNVLFYMRRKIAFRFASLRLYVTFGNIRLKDFFVNQKDMHDMNVLLSM